MTNKNIKVLNNADEVAESAASVLKEELAKKAAENEKKFYLAVSGGSTPKLLFKLLASEPYKNEIKWEYLHIFWVDERCVPPEDEESNFGMTNQILLNKVDIPPGNIHRMRGEEKPVKEIYRYADELKNYVPFQNGLPNFDLILLGMGTDGHTASLFPGSELTNIAEEICAAAVHPVSGQNRITLTEPVLNNAKEIIFMVTGKDKAAVLKQIAAAEPGSENYPAARIKAHNGKMIWYVDKSAMGE